MSWDDMVFGKGKRGCSAIKMFNVCDNIDEHISHNSISYWIDDCYLDTGMIVFKDSMEGKHLTRLIKEEDWKGISKYLDILVFRGLDVEVIKQKIKDFAQIKYDEGIRDCQQIIKGNLGIE